MRMRCLERGPQSAQTCQGSSQKFYNSVFQYHEFVGNRRWSWFAESAGLPVDAFRACMESERSFPRISAGPRLADHFAAPGTPTVVINGFNYGADVPGIGELDKRVTAILNGRPPFPNGARGTPDLPLDTGTAQATSDDDEPTCLDCAIRFDLVATLGSLDSADWLPGAPRTMARDSRGRFYLAFPNLGHVLVFDSAGNMLPRVGRSGRGPGEYHLPYLVRIARSDSIVVFDFGRQLSLVNPMGRFEKRSGPVLVDAMDLLVTGDGTVVFSGAALSSTANRPNGVFSVYDADGADIEHSFHSPDGPVGGLRPLRFYLGPSRHSDRFWATPVDRYEMMEYGIDGTLVRRITRSPSWLRIREAINEAVPPFSTIWGLAEENDQIWTVGRGTVDNWSRYWNEDVLKSSEEAGRNLIDQWSLYTSIVEVVDVDTGRLVTYANIPGLVLALFPDLYVASYRENEAGVPFIDIHRMALTRPRNGR